jgi:hypothetical protein
MAVTPTPSAVTNTVQINILKGTPCWPNLHYFKALLKPLNE